MTLQPDQQPQSLRRLLAPLVAGRRVRLAVLASVSLASGLAEATVLVLVARVGVALTKAESQVALGLGFARVEAGLWVWIGLTAGFVVVKFGLQIGAARLATNLKTGELTRARRSLFHLFIGASWRLQAEERQGHLQELLTTYAGSSANVLGLVAQGITALCTFAALLVAAFFVNSLAALAVLAAITILLGVLLPLRDRVRSLSAASATTQLEFATALTESTQMAQEIRIFGVQDAVQERMDRAIDDHGRAFRGTQFVSAVFPGIYQSAALIFVVLTLAVAYAVGAGDFAAFGAVLLVVIRSLSQGQLLQSVYQNLAANAPYLSTLENEARAYRDASVVRGGAPLSRIGEIAVEGVSFEYEPGRAVLRDLTFATSSPEIIGIVGPSGSGKSTLVQLLLRLREPTLGRVLVEGRTVSEFSMDDWYDRVTFVPQEPRLIKGSIAENIRFFREGVKQYTIEQAARSAHLHDEVMQWPDGYETDVGERGGHLSGGQRQRLCIARALIGEPDVVVFDEPTSALDARSEALVRETLAELGSRRIVVVIAHRLSTLDVCDRIMVLIDGEIQGFDEPARLEEDSAFYQEALRLSGIR